MKDFTSLIESFFCGRKIRYFDEIEEQDQTIGPIQSVTLRKDKVVEFRWYERGELTFTCLPWSMPLEIVKEEK